MAFKSGFERTLDADLKRQKVSYQYEPIKLDYVIKHKYNPDFVLSNGVIIEAKGYFRKGDTAKMKAVKEAHPTLDIRFVFMNADKKISGQKQTHGEWASRNGFPFASERIPKDWLT
jgi:hypothetical protein